METSENQQQILVTGATRGIGLAIVEAFINEGAKVIAVARHSESLDSLKSRWPKSLSTIVANLSSVTGCDFVTTQIAQSNIKLDCLINNAGVAIFQPLNAVDENSLWQQINLNLMAPIRLSQGLLPHFKSSASIVNISSYFAKRMLHNRPSSIYSACKGGIESFTKSLAFEWGSKNIRVNAIAPGTVQTSLFEHNLKQLSEVQQQNFLNQISQLYPLGRLGNPDDIAQLAVFLASEKAQWITGSIFAIDGGLTTH